MSVENPWAERDALSGRNEPAAVDIGPRRFAFYGRVSTEDNQDPEVSRGWQLERARALLALHCPDAEIVEEFFDIGYSRSLVWTQRPEASRLLADLDARDRGWEAIVVGEGKRCFYGTQFGDVAPRFTHRSVPLYIQEVGGRYDPTNTMHGMLMALSGGMSAGERETTRVRVTSSMTVLGVEGRYLGGRPPYGYTAEPYMLHPHPGKAADGVMLKRLVPDPVAAPVVRRIFEEILDNRSLRQVAHGLNTDGIPCPSAHDPKRNEHRSQDGWQTSTVAAILCNERYTGYEQWGKFKKAERLVNPNNPQQGSETYFTRNDKPPTRSLHPAHESIVSVEKFTRVQVIRAAKAAGGRKSQAKQERNRRGDTHYALRGMVFCVGCGRKMVASRYNTKNDDPTHPRFVNYRCRRRDLVEGSPALAGHPINVSIRQVDILTEVMTWLAEIFSPANRGPVLDVMLDRANVPSRTDPRRVADQKRLTEAEKGLANLVASIEQGVPPALLAPRIASLQEEAAALRDVLALSEPEAPTLTRETVEAYLDALSEAITGLAGEDLNPELLHTFFEIVRLRIDFDTETDIATAAVLLGGGAPEMSQTHTEADEAPGGFSVRVRGGT